MVAVLKATVNCDMGEGFSLYKMGDDEGLMKTIHLANIACGFHASDFNIMDQTVQLAQQNHVLVGAHPSLPDRQGFGRREMVMDPDELKNCFTYQVGALFGFLISRGLKLNHIKPHGAVYGQTSRSLPLAKAAVSVCIAFSTPDHKVAFMGLPGTMHQKAAEEAGIPFIAGQHPDFHQWFADLDYDDEGKLLITKHGVPCARSRTHDPIPLLEIRTRVRTLLDIHQVTTNTGKLLPLNAGVREVSICCHSDTPDAVKIAEAVKGVVDESNKAAGYVV
ncbi:lactam utilization protein lamb [Vararia minispora EC-137]|uniref:Lactam utilization protein lamb n=1 Tax=Vararia minispora EC-137 TaxID=1314806 RepID=A0ACB8Q9Y2_9AGAM|nr:lactam utilization protein lamb [Vararia minispora EC-137]